MQGSYQSGGRESYHLRFVVVDDNDEVRHLVSTLLQLRHGWELVGEATDGMAAVDIVNELQPDIIIMDIEMPRLNWIEATKQITQRPRVYRPDASTVVRAARRLSAVYRSRESVGERIC
jgi:CheY-like chemotaxis protein